MPGWCKKQENKRRLQVSQSAPITVAKMKEIENSIGEINIFAGGKTVIDATEVDIPDANITRVPAVLVQSRGVIDAIYYDKPFTFKNEMWTYTADEKVSVRFLYLKNNMDYFRTAMSTTGTVIDKLLPPMSRFGGGNRAEKKQGVIDKLKGFFERFFGIG